jgi:enterochelin esterase family protein
VTAVDVKTREKRVAATELAGPNGIALSPDGGTLAVSESGGEFVWTFRVNPDGTLDAKTPYMTMRRPIDPAGEFKFNEPPPLLKASKGDGMTVDSIGRWYVTSALGVQVFDPTGRLCGVLTKPQPDKPLTSCAVVRDQLFVTNGDKIFRRRVQAESAAR